MNITTVQVYDKWTPVGLAGDSVTIDATQILGGKAGEANLLTTTGGNSVYLQLDAPQTSLPADELIGVYPASGTTTSPDEYLPHIALSRYTLPWERVGPADGKPWLALILFKASDLPATAGGGILKVEGGLAAEADEQVVSPLVRPDLAVAGGAAQAGLNKPPATPAPAAPAPTGTKLLQLAVSNIKSSDPVGYERITTGAGIEASRQVNVLYLPNSVWTTIQPQLADIDLLCHVRMGSNDSAFGVVIGNRLPGLPAQAGAAPEPHTAVLISLEKRSDLFGANNTRKPADTVALLGLYQWTFTPSTGRDFADAIQAIGYSPNGGVLRFGNLPTAPAAGASAPLTAGFDAVTSADGYLETPLQVAPGGTGSYRSPLRPFTPGARENTFAVHAAPQDFTSAPAGTPPDYSYASAFELGRLIALSDAGIVEDLREVHGVLDLPKEFFATTSPAPQSLLNKAWLPDDSDWYQEPWSGALGEPAPPATADVSGISQQVGAWTSSIGTSVQAIETPSAGQTVSQQASSIDVATVTAAALTIDFADVMAAGQ